MNFSDEDIGLTPVQYTPPQQATPPAPAKGGMSDSDIGLSDADIGLNESQGHFGEWGKAFTDIPSEIGKQYSGAWQGVKEGLGPSGKGTEGVLASTLKTGQGLLNAAYLASGIGPAVVGTARSLIGHPMAEAEHAIGSTIAPDIAAQDNPEEMYQTAAGNAETALSGMGRVPGAPAPALVPGSVRRVITPNAIAPKRMVAADVWREATGEEPTAGALTGSPAVQRAESTLGDAPLAGGKYTKAMRRNNEGLARFAARSFGEDELEPESFANAANRLGNVFENSAKNMAVAHDRTFANDMGQIGADLMNEGLSDPEIKRINQLLTNVQNGFVTKNKGPSLMDGEAYQTLTRKDTPLERATRDANPNIAYYATRVRSALDDTVQRTVDTAVKNAWARGKYGGPAQARAMQLAQSAEELRDARRQWFNMLAVRSAADEEGVVTPQRLRRALTNDEDRKTMYALSRGDLAPVARAGSLLFRGMADSGTAQRSLLTALPAAILGNAAGLIAGEPISGMGLTVGASAPGMFGRALMSRPMQSYLKNQRLSRPAVPAAPAPSPGTSLITSPGRAIAPWQQPSITPNATAQIRRRFPWLATGEIPHVGDEQQRKHGGRALRTAYRARRRADGGDASDDDLVIPPASAAGTVGPNAANAVGRAVGSAAVAPLWNAGQYVGGLMHGNEQWDPSRATQLAGDLALNFLPFGRSAALAKGATNVAENATPRVAASFGMDEASRMARAKSLGYTTKAYHGTPALDETKLDPAEFNEFKTAPDDIGIHFGTAEQANERLGMHGVGNFERIYPAQLKLQNPLRLEDNFSWGADDVAHQLKNGAAPNISANEVKAAMRQPDQSSAMRSLLQSKGYDGIVYRNAMEGAHEAEGEVGRKLRATHEDLRNQWDAAIDNDNIPEQDLRRLDDRVTKAAKAYDQHMRKVGKDSYIVFNPNQVRSQFAKFDPTQASSADIMRAAVPLGGIGVAAGANNQERARGGRVNPTNIDHAPTEAQKRAGNYSKDHLSLHGLDITIENAKGKMRCGVDKGGKPWAVKMPAHYGYIKRSEGADGDHVDCYLGPHLKSPRVFIVDQLNADTGKFDEHKSFLGFGSKAQVTRAYHAAFSDGKSHERLGHIAEMPIADFKGWLKRGDTTKPLAA